MSIEKMIKVNIHSSHNTDVTVVHPLLGYVHKVLALGSFIMVFPHPQSRTLYNPPESGKIYMRWNRSQEAPHPMI
jgi:hypothetical protein